VSTNPVAKHLNKFNKPKRIESKKYKKELKRMMREAKEIQQNIENNMKTSIFIGIAYK
jgi:predicted phage-related endonuclease